MYRYHRHIINYLLPIHHLPWQHQNKEHDSSLMKWHSFTKTILRYWKGKTVCRAFLLYISSSKEVYIIYNIYMHTHISICICIHIYTYIYRWQKKKNKNFTSELQPSSQHYIQPLERMIQSLRNHFTRTIIEKADRQHTEQHLQCGGDMCMCANLEGKYQDKSMFALFDKLHD